MPLVYVPPNVLQSAVVDGFVRVRERFVDQCIVGIDGGFRGCVRGHKAMQGRFVGALNHLGGNLVGGPILVTSNLPFDEWTEVFGSERLTAPRGTAASVERSASVVRPTGTDLQRPQDGVVAGLARQTRALNAFVGVVRELDEPIAVRQPPARPAIRLGGMGGNPSRRRILYKILRLSWWLILS